MAAVFEINVRNIFVIPVETGIQVFQPLRPALLLDSGFRQNDASVMLAPDLVRPSSTRFFRNGPA